MLLSSARAKLRLSWFGRFEPRDSKDQLLFLVGSLTPHTSALLCRNGGFWRRIVLSASTCAAPTHMRLQVSNFVQVPKLAAWTQETASFNYLQARLSSMALAF